MSPEPEGYLFTLNQFIPGITRVTTEENSNAIIAILVLTLLILINAFFAMSEIAVITLNDTKIAKMAEEGDQRAKKIIQLTQNSGRFLSTIQIGITFSGFLSSASASQSFSKSLTATLSPILPIPESVLLAISTVMITLILSYFSLVLGELVPKKVAMHNSEKIAFRFVDILLGIARIFNPFITFLTFSTNVILTLLGIDPNASEATITEEEILMMVDVGEKKGVIAESAKDMISNIFDFSDTAVDEIMTHRIEVEAIENTASVEAVVKLALQKGYSRIPVFHEDLDEILGVIYAKDLLTYVGKNINGDLKITDLMRDAYFVPENKRCTDLFAEMTEHKFQMAIIIDEYGGTKGIVTLEDLLESIVGNIQDEFDNEAAEIFKVSKNAFTVDGFTSINEVSDLLSEQIPEGDYDTIAGLMMELLGRIPKPGENPSVNIKNITLTVQEITDRRISKILVVKNSVEESNEDE